MNTLWDDSVSEVYHIADRLYQGPAPREWGSLVERGITHVLNVAELPNRNVPSSIVEQHSPVADLQHIPDDYVFAVVSHMRSVLSDPSKLLFVHCAAGQNRSPTIAWLFLIACGIGPDDARNCIESNAPEAEPGHPSLVDEELVERVVEYGKANCGGIDLVLRRGDGL